MRELTEAIEIRKNKQERRRSVCSSGELVRGWTETYGEFRRDNEHRQNVDLSVRSEENFIAEKGGIFAGVPIESSEY